MDKKERERERERERENCLNCLIVFCLPRIIWKVRFCLYMAASAVFHGSLTGFCPRLSSEIFSRLRVFKIKTKMSLYSSVCIELESLLLFGFGLRFWGAR